jgi:hypothetical protein
VIDLLRIREYPDIMAENSSSSKTKRKQKQEPDPLALADPGPVPPVDPSAKRQRYFVRNVQFRKLESFLNAMEKYGQLGLLDCFPVPGSSLVCVVLDRIRHDEKDEDIAAYLEQLDLGVQPV